MKKQKPIASLSLDLDNLWSYMKTRGDESWTEFPTYLDAIVPRALAFFAERNLKITWFIVGKDASVEVNRAALATISAAGHEIGNHSFLHEPWLHLYSREQLVEELAKAEDAIMAATGRKPVGFRGPGYSYSNTLLTVLAEMGYQYDASTLPTYLGPLARIYYFMASGLNGKERKQRDLLFGSWKNGFLPLRPYLWQMKEHAMVEIPVTTMPIFRMPFHPSYVLYLACYSDELAMLYFNVGLTLCQWSGIGPSFLFHPLDFLGSDDNLPQLAFFPAMNMTSDRKLALLGRMMDSFAAKFETVPMCEHARRARSTGTLPVTKLAVQV